MIEVRRTKMYAPKLVNGKVLLNSKGKPELIPMMIRQAYIPNPVEIDGVKGFIVSCRKQDSPDVFLAIENGKILGKGQLKELEKKFPSCAEFVQRLPYLTMKAAELQAEHGWTNGKTQWWLRSQIEPRFSISAVRDTPPDTIMVKWAQCPGGQRPKWGITSTAAPLRLDKDIVHQKWFAVEDEKVVGEAELRRTLEYKFPNAQLIYGYMPPSTISGEKRLRTANEVLPEASLIGDKFVQWAAKYIGQAEALRMVDELLADGKTV